MLNVDTKKKKKRVSLGKPLPLTDQLLNETAVVTEADKAKAAELWRNEVVPDDYETLLDAKTIDPQNEETKRPYGLLLLLLFAWNETDGQYVTIKTSEPVPFLDVRNAFESLIDANSLRMNTVTQQLIDGQVTLAEWQGIMMEQIKLSHTAAAAAARGGWEQMSQADWGAAGRMIRDQYDYLRNFANEIASGKQALDGRALVRADLYGDAARGTFEQMRRRYEQLQNGMEEERRVLGEADHCPGCLEQAALEWQPIGTLDPIGAEECVTRCHCTFQFRRMGPDGAYIVSKAV